MVEFEQGGTIKKLAANAVSMVGSITFYSDFLSDMAERIKAEFDKRQVDLALVLPF